MFVKISTKNKKKIKINKKDLLDKNLIEIIEDKVGKVDKDNIEFDGIYAYINQESVELHEIEAQQLIDKSIKKILNDEGIKIPRGASIQIIESGGAKGK